MSALHAHAQDESADFDKRIAGANSFADIQALARSLATGAPDDDQLADSDPIRCTEILGESLQSLAPPSQIAGLRAIARLEHRSPETRNRQSPINRLAVLLKDNAHLLQEIITDLLRSRAGANEPSDQQHVTELSMVLVAFGETHLASPANGETSLAVATNCFEQVIAATSETTAAAVWGAAHIGMATVAHLRGREAPADATKQMKFHLESALRAIGGDAIRLPAEVENWYSFGVGE